MENPQRQVADILIGALQPETEQSQEETQVAEVEQPEAVDNQSIEPDVEAEPVEPETVEAAETDTEAGIDTLNDLASQLDADVADMYALNVKMPDAEPVTVGELKNFFLENQDIGKARQEIDALKGQLEQEKAGLSQVRPASEEQMLANARLMQLQAQQSDLENSGLRVSNPSEYLLRQNAIERGMNEAQSVLQNIGQIEEQRLNNKKIEEQKLLFDKVPTLKNDETRKQSFDGLSQLIQKYGFNPGDLEHVTDHRLMHMMLDFVDVMSKVGAVKGAKVSKAPKVLKPQAVANSQAGRKASLQRLTAKAKSGGTAKDKAAAINALLLNR